MDNIKKQTFNPQKNPTLRVGLLECKWSDLMYVIQSALFIILLQRW